MKEIGKASYLAEVVDNAGVFLLDVFATWCGPCRMLAPALAKLDGTIPGVTIGKMNLEENEDLCDTLGISALPTLLFYKDGREVKRISGVVPEDQLRKLLEEMAK
jgi:thioredoxin 1